MKRFCLPVLVLFLVVVSGCTTTNFTTNETGVSDNSTVVVKDFITLGVVTVNETETHTASPFNITITIEGSRVTYTKLMQEAARLGADDIINVRIDLHSNFTTTPFDWLTGWTRTYDYTGTALAIKFTDKLDSDRGDPELGGLPKGIQRPPNSGGLFSKK